MDYFFYNTDAGSIRDQPKPRYHVMIKGGFAAAGGARKYGERFEQLSRYDVLLMYENRVGIVAIGTVKERWDGISHTTPWYYTSREMKHLDGGASEYRIPVDWHDHLQNPITVKAIKNRLGNSPRGVVR